MFEITAVRETNCLFIGRPSFFSSS